ncbi:DNA 5'-adenosine monophosphate hydrolase [Martiniozyma asiatica (nom. inval.)]|nr:DNA 5'-adenosine monophosphate hydrolase [Martiniozyma asiatica]
MSFRYALKPFITDPKRHSKDVLFYDDKVVLIRDKFPKSAIHLLLLPRGDLTTVAPAKLTKEQIDPLNEYINLAKEIASNEFYKIWKCKNNEKVKILALLHSAPSLNNLHIHIISDDFHSPSLKTKRHFNSFQSPFAIMIDEIPLDEEDMRRGRNYSESLLKRNMQLHGDDYAGKIKVVKQKLQSEFEAKWIRIIN